MRPGCRRTHFIAFATWSITGLALCSILGCPTPSSMPTIPEKESSSEDVSTKARFRDVAAKSGIQFVPRNGHEAGHLSILESLGVGVALLDFDQNGMLDIFVPGGGEYSGVPEPIGLPAALFRNHGVLQFEAVGKLAHVDQCPFYSHGASVGDYDSDGFPDLLVTGYRGLLLYRNQGDGTFLDETVTAGLTLRAWSTSAAWGDANGDGLLDLYIANYVDWSFKNHPACIVQGHRDVCSPKEFKPLSDVFYLSNGDGTFRDATADVGLAAGGKGLGVVAADLDHDGDLDYYVANDTTPNFLYRNDGQAHFTEIGLLSGTAFGETGEAEGSMATDVGDFNGDGLPDLWVANFENQSFALYRNEGDCRFHHVSAITGITAVGAVYVGFGTTFFDLDLDGDEDLFATNGHVMNQPANASVRQRPLLFENLNGERFVNVASSAGDYMSSPHLGRGVACGDLDDDGDSDLVVSHTNEPIAVLRNDSPVDAHSLKICLIGTFSNRDAVGARVTVRTGDRTWTRQIKGGSSYLSSSDHAILFGLDRYEQIDAIEVIWPRGATTMIAEPHPQRSLTIRESISLTEP